MSTDDWTTVTARKQQPLRAIVTPMVNRYQGLDDDTASVHSSTSDAHTEASAYTVESTMSEPEYKTQSKSVKDYISKTDLKPMSGNVTSLDVDNFQEIVAQALSKIKSRYISSEVAMLQGIRSLLNLNWVSNSGAEMKRPHYHHHNCTRVDQNMRLPQSSRHIIET